MSTNRHRALSLGQLRAFEALARRLSFREVAEEMHITQSAVSRQIKSLEDELGAALFLRGTRHVEITPDGQALLGNVAPWLAKLDASVRQIRAKHSRRRVNITTFASFASLWLLPQMEAFQKLHPDIDLRVSANDALDDLDDPDLDLALRYCSAAQAPGGALRLFGETLTPAISRQLAERIQAGLAPPLASVADLAQHTLAEEDDSRPSSEYLSWRHWLSQHGQAGLQPRRWLYLNFTYQQVQAALAGQGVALARVALVFEALQRGELVEPFGAAGRIASPYAYWLIVPPGSRGRPEVAQLCGWIEQQAALTRLAIGEAGAEPAAPEARQGVS
ncbi:MAG: LysR substrate-binding domain-containing protein [Rhizobacter sp.]|nr:LysR substrate-binding domain-containing protein [Rhizobacter sp.]